ncbi:MAG TPA: Gfo/Idh/MocA family oxidoreductase [Roseiarcus sp.]|nr:Gfo/Idh/MocA family oxidoreductase [Roseiarcus sp.]
MKTFNLGIIGCGVISAVYFRNAPLFRGLKIVACADVAPEAAKARAKAFGVPALSVEKLLASDDIDIVINLTPPNAHYEVSMAALKSGKHVFTEKPLAARAALGRKLVDAAKKKGLSIASAPDTFLGAAGRKARALIDAGAIGRPVTGTAFVFGHGMEHWHPNPEFFYKAGGGPVLDLGPYYLTMLVNLIGPIVRVRALTSIGEARRLVTAAGPNQGAWVDVETPTTALALVEFASGPHVVVGMSWDVWRHGAAPIEIHGTQGSLRAPDPNFFGGVVEVSTRGADWAPHPTASDAFGASNQPADAPRVANYRVLGVADLAAAIREGRPPRAGGALALHVLEAMEAILRAGASGRAVSLPPAEARPAVLSESEALALLA